MAENPACSEVNLSQEIKQIPAAQEPETSPRASSQFSAPPVTIFNWILVIGVCCSSINAHINQICFAVIPYETAEIYNITSSQIGLLSFVQFPCGIVGGILAVYFYDCYQLKSPLLFSTYLNVIGCIFKLASCYVSTPSYLLLLIGQIFAAASCPFYSNITTKLSAVWFPENFEVLANSLMTIAVPAGFVFPVTVGPALLSTPSIENLTTMLWIYTVPALIGIIFIHITMFSSASNAKGEPIENYRYKTGQEIKLQGFFQSLKTCFTSKNYLINLLGLGCGIGVFNVLAINFINILCPLGYSQQYAGQTVYLITVLTGMAGNVILGRIVDKFKLHIERICKTLTVLLIITNSLIAYFYQNKYNYPVSIILSVGLGSFALPLLPIAMKLSVESTYPAGPAIASGIGFIVGNVFATLFGIIFGLFTDDLDPEWQIEKGIENVCQKNDADELDQDYGLSLIVMICTASFFQLVWIFIFKNEFKKLKMEQKQAMI